MTWPRKEKRRALWTQSAGGLKPNGWKDSGWTKQTGPSGKRSSTSSAPTRRSGMRRRSKQLESQMRLYRERVVLFLMRNRRCAVFPSKRATQVHHVRGRQGSLLLDERFWLQVSAEGHDKIHRELNWARAKGFLAKWGEWNVAPKASLGNGHHETTA